MAEIDAILAHIEHMRGDIANLCSAVAGLEKEISDMKLTHQETYIPKNACVDIQKRCAARMDNSVSKDSFRPVKLITYGLVGLILIQVFKVLLSKGGIE